MRKFSNIHNVNEEFLNIFKKRSNEDTFIQSTKPLLELYSKNLLSEGNLSIHHSEKEDYDFTEYKITSITKIGYHKYKVTMDTFTDSGKLKELTYFIEIK